MELVQVTCPECGTETTVLIESEFGSSEWSGQNCGHCGTEFNGSESYTEAEALE